MSARAEVELVIDGAAEAAAAAEATRSGWVRAAEDIGNAWDKAGGKLKSLGGSAIREVGAEVSKLATDAIRLGMAFQNLNLAGAVSSAKQFDDAMDRIVVSKRVGMAELSGEFRKTSDAIMVGERAIAAQSSALARLTGDFKGAVAAQKGLGEEALATGRTSEEMIPFGAVLKNVLNVAGDTSDAIGVIRAQARDMATTGGPAALEAQLVSLSGAMSHFSAKTEEQRNRLTGLVAVLGKGQTPEVAQRTAASVLGTLDSNWEAVNRTVGYDAYDENGHAKDPARLLSEIRARSKMGGASRSEQLRRTRRTFGLEAGSILFNADLSQVDALAHASSDGSSHQAAVDFAGSTSGQRETREIQNERAMRDHAHSLLAVQDALGSALSGSPLLGAFGGNLLAAGGIAVLKRTGKWLMGKKGAGSAAEEIGKSLVSANPGDGSRVFVINWPSSLGGIGSPVTSAGGAVPSIASRAAAVGATVAEGAAGGMAITIAGAATIAIAGAAAISLYHEQSDANDSANRPGFEGRHARARDAFMYDEEIEGTGFAGMGAVLRRMPKRGVSDIIAAAAGRGKLSPDQLFDIDKDKALSGLLAVSKLGHVPGRADLRSHRDLVDIWERLPADIADRLAEALRANPAEVHVDGKKVADAVKDKAGGMRHGKSRGFHMDSRGRHDS